ncbi:MAG: hypothetical protein LAT67_05310 [Balneolales bacterium]|nr:hypothetical protein [Balneolales bacterium]
MKKNKKALITVFIIFGVLVAPHEGEFWPFSIFPMFSQAGNPWVRSHVRVVDYDENMINWKTVGADQLDGDVLSMVSLGVNQNDVSNFVSKTAEWNERALSNMRALLGEVTSREQIMIYKVTGSLHPEISDSVVISYQPYIFMSPEATILHPDLRGDLPR